ncbi:MAG: hypothetical protein FWF23_00400 [Alphaproteobacteria bacterium]|nr:hypothetical protein [Alphaproteobacteria bacterium]MCL2505679.1 hypothetical protein [Alphaproteobacteria bacterium]
MRNKIFILGLVFAVSVSFPAEASTPDNTVNKLKPQDTVAQPIQRAPDQTGSEQQTRSFWDATNTNLFHGLGVSGSPMFVSGQGIPYFATYSKTKEDGLFDNNQHVPGGFLQGMEKAITYDKLPITPKLLEESVLDRAQKNALAKFVIAPDADTSAALTDNFLTAWRTRCEQGFLPMDEHDPEGKINASLESDVCDAGGTYARWDRSLESLLGPLQYLAPKDMNIPGKKDNVQRGDKPFSRFPKLEKPEEDYAPIYAAAYFCMNLGMYSFAALEGIPALDYRQDIIREVIMQETIDSKGVANCWRFFEERVQYPPGFNPPAYHALQRKRCEYDFQHLHIITREQYEDCAENGRSDLQARFDMANRIYSEEYQQKFIKYLGATQRAIIIGLAMADAEKFQQTLLLQRQIMATVMGTTRIYPASFGGQSYEVESK